MFIFIYSNFEWKHSNLRLRLHLHWIMILDKYQMIARTLRPLIQLNLPLMFYINEILISSEQYKKKAFEVILPWLKRPFIQDNSPPSATTLPPCFPLHNIEKNVETNPPPMCGVTIEQRLKPCQTSLMELFLKRLYG